MANWWEVSPVSSVRSGGDGGPSQKPVPDFDCPPGERRKPTQDGWTCVPDGSSGEPGPAAGTCPAGSVPETVGSDGNWRTAGPGECISQAEFDRRVDLNIKNNPNKGEPGAIPNSTTGGYVPPAAPKATKSPYDAAMSKLLFDQLQAMINGEGQPFSPEVVAKLNAGALGSNKSQLETSQRDLQKRLIASGLSRSGVAPAEQGRLRSRADASLSGDFRNVAITAVQGNYAAKAQALAQAQQFLNSERANALSTDQLTFGYAQLSQQWKALQAQFDQQKWVIQNGNEQDLIKLLIQLQNGGLR